MLLFLLLLAPLLLCVLLAKDERAPGLACCARALGSSSKEFGLGGGVWAHLALLESLTRYPVFAAT